MADYAPRSCVGPGTRVTAGRAPAVRRCRGVRYGAVVRHADARGSFRELWRADVSGADRRGGRRTSGSRRDSSRRTCRPRRPACCAASTSTGASSTTGSSPTGRAFVALVDVRPLLDGSGTGPLVETRELAADDWVVIPAGVAHGFLALEPLELLYLVTNEYDGSDELGFAWDDPAVGGALAADLGDARTAGPILSERDATNPPLADLVAACAPDARDRAASPDRHSSAPLPYDRPDPKGLAVPGPSRD